MKIAGAKEAPKVSEIHKCMACGKGLVRRAGKKAGTNFWSCSGYPTCSQTYPDAKGKPNYAIQRKEK
ncbi:topoisomerase DNA-binding C4 zinc finger domain-containing protein [Caballeronia sp. BR00000012568055]|uniref:topoisomerase DNA-binding C4 zinc finger domain-containing protein n=1 Tax=Caballeronia sp. BR00000012568055 TaxID=2918761 RepID=UPI0023F91CC5